MMNFGVDFIHVCVCLCLCVIGTSMETERFFRWKQCSLSVCGRICSYCLCQIGYVFTRVRLLVGWLVCQQAYIKTVEWISTKLGWRMEGSHLQLVSEFVCTAHVHLEPNSVSRC